MVEEDFVGATFTLGSQKDWLLIVRSDFGIDHQDEGNNAMNSL